MERRDTLPLRRARVHESREHDEIDATADARFVDGGPPKSKKSMGLSQRFRFQDSARLRGGWRRLAPLGWLARAPRRDSRVASAPGVACAGDHPRPPSK